MNKHPKFAPATLLAALAIGIVALTFSIRCATAQDSRLMPPLTPRQLEALARSTSTPEPLENRVALYQALLDLQNPWTVMCVAAHPDDEDGTSLIVMRHKYGAHTVSLFSTFGEGGQNAIGPELYEELGAIRARETMAAAEIQGSEPHFLGLKDFGFSKTRDEAFRFWGHEEALRRMVLQIRKLRPDVIITNHSTTSNDHGQHQATALMVVEAFDAAADATKFPEQLKDGVTTWQVQRLFVRTRGNPQQAVNTQIITIDPNEKDPVRGVVYAEEALRGLQQHATQGPWPKSFAEYANRFRAFSGQNAATGQLPMIRYTLVKSATGTTALPNDSHNFLDGLQLPGDLARHLAPPTVDGKALTDSINDRELLTQKLAEFDGRLHSTQVLPFRVMRPIAATREALAALAGITARLSLVQPVVEPGTNASAKLEIANHGTGQLQVGPISTWLTDFNGESKVLAKVAQSNGMVAVGETKTFQLSQSVPSTATITVPSASHLYDNAWRGFAVDVVVNFKVNGKGFSLNRQVSTDVAPAVEITSISPLPLVIHDDVRASSAGVDVSPGGLPQVRVQLVNHRSEPFKGEIVYGRDRGKEQTSKVELLAHQNTTVALFSNAERTLAAHARASESTEMLSIAVRTSDSRAIITKRTVPIARINTHVAQNLRVGFIRGFDFSLPNALNALGVESKELSVDEVKTGDLSQFTSVIVDNRVYESKPELIAVNQKLLDYANAGGNLIVFYHKSDEWNPDERRNRPQLAPFKLILGGERITDENAPISFLEPNHPLLNTPNKMGQDDFKDWIQERGLYYPKEWDPQFHALLQSNDPGEQPLKGGLLVADYGKGHYIYTSMVWYRELRGGIPGAYRMLANMISYGAQAK